MSCRRVNNNSLTWWYVLKTSSRCLEDTFLRRLEEVLKMSWRRFCKTSWWPLQDVLARRLEDVSPRRIYSSWSRHLEHVLKPSSEDVWLMGKYTSLLRRLEDVFWRRRRITPSRCLQDIFIKTNICWGGCFHFYSYSFHENPFKKNVLIYISSFLSSTLLKRASISKMGHGPDAKRSVKCDGCQKGGKSCKNEGGGIGNICKGRIILWKIIIKYGLLEKIWKIALFLYFSKFEKKPHWICS